jgi:hypothetical protein
MNRKLGQHGHLFQQRYWAALVEQHAKLPEVVRYIHLMPVRRGIVRDPVDYNWSSHHAYLGFAKTSWVTTGAVFRAVDSPGRYRREAYRQFMQEGLHEIAASGRGADAANEASGRAEDAEFLARLAPRRRTQHDPALLDRIINSVCTKLDVPREQMLSPSRRRSLSLARALVAWHATCNEVATLTEVAKRFQRNPSVLSVGVERYRRTRRELFEEPMGELLSGEIEHAKPDAAQSKCGVGRRASTS